MKVCVDRRALLSSLLVFSLLFLPSAWAIRPGDVFKNGPDKSYSVVQRLGKGDFGTVWQVRDDQNGSYFAVKFFKKRPDGKTLDVYEEIAAIEDQGLAS